MRRKVFYGVLMILAVVLATVAAFVMYDKKTAAPKPDLQTHQQKSSSETPSPEKRLPNGCPASSATAGIAAGRYFDYSEKELKQHCFGYNATILFFHAPWCPECRGFDQAIKTGEVPAGVQILKVDYDSSQDLRKKYGVTIQTTFVRVNSAGEKQALWTGYGRDKSIRLILENTQ